MVGSKIYLQIHRQTATSDGMGGQTIVWYGVKTLRGSLISFKAKERFINDSTKVSSTHYFQCDFPKDIVVTEKDRAFDMNNGDLYQINFVDNLANRDITLSLELKKVE